MPKSTAKTMKTRKELTIEAQIKLTNAIRSGDKITDQYRTIQTTISNKGFFSKSNPSDDNLSSSSKAVSSTAEADKPNCLPLDPIDKFVHNHLYGPTTRGSDEEIDFIIKRHTEVTKGSNIQFDLEDIEANIKALLSKYLPLKVESMKNALQESIIKFTELGSPINASMPILSILLSYQELLNIPCIIADHNQDQNKVNSTLNRIKILLTEEYIHLTYTNKVSLNGFKKMLNRTRLCVDRTKTYLDLWSSTALPPPDDLIELIDSQLLTIEKSITIRSLVHSLSMRKLPGIPTLSLIMPYLESTDDEFLFVFYKKIHNHLSNFMRQGEPQTSTTLVFGSSSYSRTKREIYRRTWVEIEETLIDMMDSDGIYFNQYAKSKQWDDLEDNLNAWLGRNHAATKEGNIPNEKTCNIL